MTCDIPCDKCPYLGKQCDGTFDEDGSNEIRQCGERCGHYDSLNQCCWQATEQGLCFPVTEGDHCYLGYKENDSR